MRSHDTTSCEIGSTVRPMRRLAGPRGAVPHHLPGTNTFLTEYATRHGLPQSAARGGAATMYPDYVPELRRAIEALR